MNHNYPVFLSLDGRICLVSGAGQVGLRKIKGLLTAKPASIRVFDPNPCAEAKKVCANPCVTLMERSCCPEDFKDVFLAFACSDSSFQNEMVATLCLQRNILCNNAAAPEEGSFILPSIARHNELCIAVSTSGLSPMLARIYKEELCEWLLDKGAQVWLLGQLRPLIIKNLSPETHRQAFAQIIQAPLVQWLESGAEEMFTEWFKKNFPHISTAKIENIISDYRHVHTD